MLFQHAWKHHSWYPHEVVASLPEGHSLLRVCLAWAQCRWHPKLSEPLREIPIRSFRGEGPRASSSATSEACILKLRRVSGRFVTDRISTETPLELQKDVLCPPGVLLCGALKKHEKTPKPKKQRQSHGWSWTWRMDTSKIPFRSSWQVVKLFVDELSHQKSGVQNSTIPF